MEPKYRKKEIAKREESNLVLTRALRTSKNYQKMVIMRFNIFLNCFPWLPLFMKDKNYKKLKYI
jgi:hypothetical protein